MKFRRLVRLASLTCMFLSFHTSYASQDVINTNFQSSQWVKTIGYIVEPSSQLGPVPFSSLSIYVPNNLSKTDKIWAVYSKSDLMHFMSSEDTSVKALEIPRSKYFRLLDLASKEAGVWELFVYDKLGHCHMPKKQLIFNGKSQSIISVCGYETSLPAVSQRVLRLSAELEVILEKVEMNGKSVSLSDEYEIGIPVVE